MNENNKPSLTPSIHYEMPSLDRERMIDFYSQAFRLEDQYFW